jgi:hypothetical protein
MPGRAESDSLGPKGAMKNQRVSRDYLPDEIIVKFKAGVSEEEIASISRSENIERMKALSPHVYLFRITGTTSVGDTIGSLVKRREVEYAEPNYIDRVK